jgi:TetR/AcrR family transcriptional regulator, transcriptional repressor for nem operon
MRYEKGHKETTRQHIVDVASRQFREGGVAAVGIAGIMSAAGLTNGAFYVHFESKEDLVRAVFTDALERRDRGLQGNLERNESLKESIRDYLSVRHRDHAGSGCPTAAMVAEIARHPQKTQEVFTDNVERIIVLIAGRLRSGSAAERRRKAMAIYGVMVGSLQMARAVNDTKLSDEILENALEGALTLAGER